MTATPPLVALDAVAVRYGGRDVLHVDRLDAFAGEVLAVIGPNGSGKSTLLRVLGLLEAPSSGVVRFRGSAVDARRALAERREMATVFQHPHLADTSVVENVALGLRFRGVDRADRQPRVDRWLERLGIAGLARRRARDLSAGEAQRVALARALVLDPAVLLLDEPFAALDQPTRAALLEDLGTILRGDRVTTVLVTHDRGEAQVLADRVAVILGGRIHQLDGTARVFSAPVSEEVARFVGVETIVDGRVLGRQDGVSVVDVAGHTVEVAAAAEPGERVRLCLRPEDVIVARPGERAAVSTARNHLAGTIVRLTPTTGHVRVVMDCGFPLVAAVTPRSVEELALGPGVAISARFEASAAHLLPQPLLDTRREAGL